MHFKKLLALLLAALMLVSVLPAANAASAKEEKITGDVWELINAYEDAHLGTSVRSMNGVRQAEPSAFAAMSEGVESVVRSWAGFREGTISRHGDFFFWEDVDGNAYGYSPRMRSQIRKDAANAAAAPEELAGVEVADYSVRGGSAGSVNVAVFQPYYGLDSSFQVTYSTEGQRIAAATGGTSSTYKTTSATIDAVASALENCGVVIFDSHGDTDYASGEDYVTRANTSYLCMQTNAGWTSADQQAVTGPYGTYYHCFNAGGYGSMKYYMVDGTGFANHMSKNGCNNLLWMAICLGMATDGLWKPLRSKGVEVVYGYSQSVSFSGDYDYEADFWDKMIDGDDVASAFAYMTRTYKWDPAYAADSSYDTIGEARYNFVAFPNVVSSEDAYQGHRTKNPTSSSAANSTAYNADYGACNLQTVNSAWTLFSQYAVTAVSNNAEWGTVSVNGKVITASPKAGYYAKDAEVISGTATVAQEGNVFTVTPESDCTVRVNFAAKTPATISFVTPDGVSCDSISTYVGDEFTLPAPTGEPTADGHEYRFVGWTEATLADTTERPAYQIAGKTLKVTGDATYYALYVYTVATGGPAGFVQLDGDPGSWAGEYILTYNGSIVLDASGSHTGSQLGSKDAAVAIAGAGMSVSGGVIADPNDDFVYVIEASSVTPGAWTIRMKNSDNYIAYTGNTNSVTTTADPTSKNAQWNLSYTGGLVSLQNANTVSAAQVRYLQYNTTSKQFRCYTNTQKNLTLFAGESGTRYYTTELTTAAADPCAAGHDWGEPTYAWAEDYSSCTATRVCKNNAGHVESETASAQGVETKPATEEEDGEIIYTAVFENKDFGMREIAVVIPKLQKPAFDDVDENAYYAEPVAWAVENGVTNGTSPTTFSPDKDCSRAQVVTFLWRAKGSPAPATTDNPFTDVAPGAYYYQAVLWAVENGITTGTGATTFSPDRACTRAQVVTFLWRTEGKPAAGANNPFGDVKAGEYYTDAVLWAVAEGITTGTGATTFSPGRTCTRGQIVTFLYRDLA